jgi:hypothetical protein
VIRKSVERPAGRSVLIHYLPMYFVLFEATPRRDARTAPEAAGAYVSCWIERPTLDEAVRVARTGIEAEGWIVGEPDEAYEVMVRPIRRVRTAGNTSNKR